MRGRPGGVRPGHRPDVEGLRAVAVGLVVAYHAGVPFVSGGFIGVDVFFVLSGFLITGLLADELTREGRLSFARFYGRRARRLLPMSTVVLIATAIAFSFLVSPLDRATLATDIRSAALYVANWHFAAASFDYLGNPSKSPVLHYWSLGVEEQFYVVWPLLLFLVARRAARRSGPAAANRRMIGALAGLAVVSFVLCLVMTTRSAPYAYYGLHTRAWELAAGGLLALGATTVQRVPGGVRRAAGWLGLGTVLTSAILIGAATPFPGWAALGPVLGTVLVVAAGGATTPVGVDRLLATRPFTYVGRISYSWYLWHWPCLLFAAAVTSGRGGRAIESFRLAHGWTAAVAVAVSFALSSASHHLLEDPVRRSRWLAAVRFRSLALGAALTAVSVLGVTLVLPATTGRPSGPVLAEVAPAWPGGQPQGLVSAERTLTLTQSPAQARNDDPLGTRDCYAGYVPSTAPPDCQFGDPNGTVTIALVGDSHAEQWFPAMVRAAQVHHWRLWMWAKTACPLIGLRVQLPQFHDTYPSCEPWRAAVFDRLASIPDLDAVVVSHYGSLITRGGRFASADGRTLTGAALPDAWQRSWATTAATLARDARRVIVIRDVPKPSTDVPACLAAHGTDVRPCSFSRSFAFARADVLYAAEHRVGLASARFVDLDALLCPGDPCPVIAHDGSIIYRDAHHLTARISSELAPELAQRLSVALSG
jgi:peptidoglycan/LPS O-acetylase OafA/YrhL